MVSTAFHHPISIKQPISRAAVVHFYLKPTSDAGGDYAATA